MKSARNLTQRVIWALTSTVAVFVTMLVVLAFVAFGRMEDDLVNGVVLHETERLTQQMAAGDVRLTNGELVGLGDTLRAWLVVGPTMPPTMPQPLHVLDAGVHELNPNREIWHVRVEDLPSGRLVVMYNATENEQRVYDFGLIVLGLGLVCVLAAYMLSRRLAGLVVAPLHVVADRLLLWAPGAMRDDVDKQDEPGKLLQAFDRVQQDVDRMMAAESEFGANLSHEVRTPLAAMRSDGEIMLLDSSLGRDMRLRIERVVRNVDAVTAALESARAVALNTPQMPSRVNLFACMQDAWMGLSARAHASGLSLDNQLPAHATAVVDPHALMTVIRNLMGNAIEHAAPATLSVTLHADALHIEDDGPGIAAADLPYVFERYYSARRRDSHSDQPFLEDQRGLGLAIAKRVCDLHGWSLTAHPRGRARGVTFKLALQKYGLAG